MIEEVAGLFEEFGGPDWEAKLQLGGAAAIALLVFLVVAILVVEIRRW